MVEAEKQGVIYSVGFIVAILIGFFVWQSKLYDRWEGLFAFGRLSTQLMQVALPL